MCEINKEDVGSVCIKIKFYNKNLVIALVIFFLFTSTKTVKNKIVIT